MEQYFSQLLKYENIEETFEWAIVESNDCECLPPNGEEIKQQIKKLKNQKSSGEYGIRGEILKRLDEKTISRIHYVIEKFSRRKDSWRNSIVC